MPLYEYVCTACKKKTEVRASLEEKTKGLKVTCPFCGSNKTAQVFGNFMSGSSAGSGDGSSCCAPTTKSSC